MTDKSSDLWARAIVEQNQRWLLAYFLTACGDPSAAEDLTQEVFVEALKSQDQFNPQLSFGVWLRGIARNLLHQHFRQSKRRPLLLNDQHLDRLDALAEHAWEEQADPQRREGRLEALKKCMQELTARMRTMLQYRYEERRGSREIGAQLGMTAESVDMALSRARKALGGCVRLRAEDLAHG